MSKEPQKVELLENGVVKLTLHRSSSGSLNGTDGYTGRATSARIHGPVGSLTHFYDDQQFKTGENHVQIEKTVAEPITVPLTTHFVGRDEAHGDGVYEGRTRTYDYTFFRARKLEWWEEFVRSVPAGQFVFDSVKKFAEESDHPWVKGTVTVLKTLGEAPDGNYRVDNVSSVRFGM